MEKNHRSIAPLFFRQCPNVDGNAVARALPPTVNPFPRCSGSRIFKTEPAVHLSFQPFLTAPERKFASFLDVETHREAPKPERDTRGDTRAVWAIILKTRCVGKKTRVSRFSLTRHRVVEGFRLSHGERGLPRLPPMTHCLGSWFTPSDLRQKERTDSSGSETEWLIILQNTVGLQTCSVSQMLLHK